MRTAIYFLTYAWIILLASCDRNKESEATDSGGYINLQLRTSSTGINEDVLRGEDRVTEVRMMAFDVKGGVVYNAMLNFPNGLSQKCEAVKFPPGIYDFHFIANESVYPGLTSALAAVSQAIQLQSDPILNALQYDPDFHPDASTVLGRFLMSASYKGIRVFSGGTQDDPQLLLLPTAEVELIRSLAKVEVVFRKKTAGSTIPAEKYILSVQARNTAANSSVPAVDRYYTGPVSTSNNVNPSGLNYSNDSIGTITFYVPEFLNKKGGTVYTELCINNRSFPILTDQARVGLTDQRRNMPLLSDSSVVRNYHYMINAYIDSQGDIFLKTGVEPWTKSSYTYMFQDPGQGIVIPPILPTDSSVVVPTSCGKIEIRSSNEYLQQGLQGAYGDVVNWWDPNVQGPNIIKGKTPYYCEKKYGKEWRIIESCEMMSFLSLFDQTYRIWQSNTWQGINSGLSLYPVAFRRQAQELLEKLTGTDLSGYEPSEIYGGDTSGGVKLGILDQFFTPGDIVVTTRQFPNGWPYPAPPFTGIEDWYPMEVVHQVKGYWYSGYLNYSDPDNYDRVLYQEFQRYSFSSTVTRCVRSVE
ncbi:hypothetical protein JCM10512_2544 [Bacteroides reticulotermitis JCM 10512]|uniref:Uncharacterized protein n=1 Tax=Bacteroides reticulotermitis JCM 10512 TaxID=1445607 RepID=W4USL8_9BACE|nr:hypothetical protein JCM10512_2544 [Bacteroides reticulotermitis JCM 10512]